MQIGKEDGYFKYYDFEYKKGSDNIFKLPIKETLQKNKIDITEAYSMLKEL